MNPPSGNAGLAWRIERLEEERAENETARKLAEKHELELHGERGVYKGMKELADEMRRVKLALWGVAASIITAAITLVASGVHP